MNADPDLDDLRARLSEVMEESGMSQVDVAAFLDVSQSVVSKFLRGIHKPRPATVQRIQSLLGEGPDSEVLSHEDIRRGARLFRYLRDQIVEEGAEVVLRYKDGTEKTIVLLW